MACLSQEPARPGASSLAPSRCLRLPQGPAQKRTPAAPPSCPPVDPRAFAKCLPPRCHSRAALGSGADSPPRTSAFQKVSLSPPCSRSHPCPSPASHLQGSRRPGALSQDVPQPPYDPICPPGSCLPPDQAFFSLDDLLSISVSLCVSISLHLCFTVSVCLHLCLSLSFHLCLCLPHLCLCRSLCLLSLSFHLYLSPSLRQCLHLYLSPSLCLYLHLCLSVFPSLSLSSSPCLCVSVSISISISVSVFLSLPLSPSLSLHLRLCPCVSVSPSASPCLIRVCLSASSFVSGILPAEVTGQRGHRKSLKEEGLSVTWLLFLIFLVFPWPWPVTSWGRRSSGGGRASTPRPRRHILTTVPPADGHVPVWTRGWGRSPGPADADSTHSHLCGCVPEGAGPGDISTGGGPLPQALEEQPGRASPPGLEGTEPHTEIRTRARPVSRR
ncbi:uncharacterized protein LOC144225588 [Crocuta crocuta]